MEDLCPQCMIEESAASAAAPIEISEAAKETADRELWSRVEKGYHVQRAINEAVDHWKNCTLELGHQLGESKSELLAKDEMIAELKANQTLYLQLIYAVARKFPNESRHQTALRYLQRAEAESSQVSNAAREESIQ